LPCGRYARIGKERGMEEHGGEVCLEEEVERLRERGLSAEEISAATGLDAGWVRDLLERLGLGEG
ncbi:MAG: hypothetical protein L0G70_09610, partial [Rubrobacter sp.]|nr:hypothetical protein [Rubrobacter sp.]